MIFIFLSLILLGCGSAPSRKVVDNLSFLAEGESPAPGDVMDQAVLGNFDADSAYKYLAQQVAFGPRVPNTEAHRKAGDWLTSQLRRHGSQVIEQKAQLTAFDGTVLSVRNIFGRFNPEQQDRLLLLAHWDCRPWADQDPDPAKRKNPVDGANDGASGVAVLLELARQISLMDSKKGIDILFVDAEDWGSEGDDESWALGTKYFVDNLPIEGYKPSVAILLDMVGGENATFCREYFSEKAAPELADRVWQEAQRQGFGDIFINKMGSAILDDHVPLIKAGIPAIDIVEYRVTEPYGFNPRWHTTADDMSGISKTTLQAVGSTLSSILLK